MKLRLGQIPQKFLSAWLAFHEITLTQNDVSSSPQGFIIQRIDITSAITQSFRNFRQSKKTFDNFFQRSVIFVQLRNDKFLIKNDEIGSNPLFVWLPDHHFRSDIQVFSYNVPIENLFSLKPVKMQTTEILKLFNIDEHFECIFDLEEKYDLAIDFYETDGIGFWRSSKFPGFKSKVKQRIQLAKDVNENTYWLPPMVEPKQKFQCRKFPGKCRYLAEDIYNLERHMEKCIAETKIVTKKVIWLYKIKY